MGSPAIWVRQKGPENPGAPCRGRRRLRSQTLTLGASEGSAAGEVPEMLREGLSGVVLGRGPEGQRLVLLCGPPLGMSATSAILPVSPPPSTRPILNPHWSLGLARPTLCLPEAPPHPTHTSPVAASARQAASPALRLSWAKNLTAAHSSQLVRPACCPCILGETLGGRP